MKIEKNEAVLWAFDEINFSFLFIVSLTIIKTAIFLWKTGTDSIIVTPLHY